MDGHRRIFAEAGRGGGKTLIAALLMLESATTFNRGLPHLWSEPTYRDWIRVFMRTWSMLVPRDLWTFNKSDMCVTLSPRIGGATIDLFSRHSRDSESEPRGPTYAGAVSDEVAKDANGKIFKLVAPLLRDPGAKLLWHLSITTPRPGWYAQLLRASNDDKIRWSSYDNTYISKAVFDGFSVDMTEDERRQEIFAEHVSLAGLVWSEYKDAPSPAGNRHPHKFDPRQPWSLACDIGNRSAWLVMQTVASSSGPVDVIVAEYQPDHGDTTAMIDRISRDYGYPSTVVAGSDASDAHRSIQTGKLLFAPKSRLLRCSIGKDRGPLRVHHVHLRHLSRRVRLKHRSGRHDLSRVSVQPTTRPALDPIRRLVSDHVGNRDVLKGPVDVHVPLISLHRDFCCRLLLRRIRWSTRTSSAAHYSLLLYLMS
jgi:hypothetical protein